MIEESAQVTALRGDEARVQGLGPRTCGSCRLRGGCGQRLLAEMIGHDSLDLYVDNSLAVQPGDQVVLGIGEAALLRASLLVYLFPLMGLLAGAVLGDLLFALGDGTTALLAMAGMALFLLLGIAVQRRAGPGQFKPVLLQILRPGSARQARGSGSNPTAMEYSQTQER